ncbi:Uu.00g134350.m01.CDS01 [Anthostomella pinea]|uniref:Uu.00g134350.m01.CDS01 n=1 Tax=Anthostomella pinea TaxID=933095 RepID=A0AAI8VNW9_9PEZI|nr:Uu.00g134350.m01.CDS01 [Anthostomella pinea]
MALQSCGFPVDASAVVGAALLVDDAAVVVDSLVGVSPDAGARPLDIESALGADDAADFHGSSLWVFSPRASSWSNSGGREVLSLFETSSSFLTPSEGSSSTAYPRASTSSSIPSPLSLPPTPGLSASSVRTGRMSQYRPKKPPLD